MKRPYNPADGVFEPAASTNVRCGRCGREHVLRRRWRSHEGGFTDDFYQCQACRYEWWVQDVVAPAEQAKAGGS